MGMNVAMISRQINRNFYALILNTIHVFIVYKENDLLHSGVAFSYFIFQSYLRSYQQLIFKLYNIHVKHT